MLCATYQPYLVWFISILSQLLQWLKEMTSSHHTEYINSECLIYELITKWWRILSSKRYRRNVILHTLYQQWKLVQRFHIYLTNWLVVLVLTEFSDLLHNSSRMLFRRLKYNNYSIKWKLVIIIVLPWNTVNSGNIQGARKINWLGCMELISSVFYF